MTVQRVEVNEIGHQEAAVFERRHQLDNFLHHCGIASHFHFFACTHMAIDVADLAH